MAYKFQVAVSIVFHKAGDPAVVIQPPVTLTSEIVAVYADAPPPNDANRQLLNFTEYEQNGSGCFFSNFVSCNCHYGILIHKELARLFHCLIGYTCVELLLILEGLETIAFNVLYWQACTLYMLMEMWVRYG